VATHVSQARIVLPHICAAIYLTARHQIRHLHGQSLRSRNVFCDLHINCLCLRVHANGHCSFICSPKLRSLVSAWSDYSTNCRTFEMKGNPIKKKGKLVQMLRRTSNNWRQRCKLCAVNIPGMYFVPHMHCMRCYRLVALISSIVSFLEHLLS
jgi:hypothetical protein